MRAALSAFSFLLALSGGAFAQTAQQQAAIERAERIGRDLYEHDRAAWLATDAALAEFTLAQRARMRGWVTEREGESVVVTFVAEDDGALRSGYRAVFNGGALTERRIHAAPLTEHQTHLFQARQTATTQEVTLCGPPYNAATVPREQGDGVDVYLMPATSEHNLVRVGGFHRIGVDLASGGVIDFEAFSRSCLEVGDTPPPGTTEAMIFVTHVLSDTPAETHVFLSLSTGAPLFVSTRAGLWRIANGRITFVPDGEPT